jgi:signal transduction histidine kinase
MEVALLTSTELASRSINAARLGWWAWAMVSDSMTWGGHFEGLLGCEPGGFEGTIGALLARIDDADREQVDARIRLAMLGEDFEGLRFAVPLKDGTKRWLEMCGGLTRALEDSAPRVSGVLRDITREVEAEVRKRREVMLKEKESRLQDAERATRELETFCLAAAHDLRKPLHTISSFGHLLLRDDGARLTTAGQNRLARICAAAERMSEMVEKMLQLGQYGQAGLNPASFSLRDAIEAVLSDLDSPAGVSVEIPERFEVYADLVLIREVIANLVGNAVKYSRTRAEPDIVIGASRQGGEVLVWVRDNGVGFPVEEAHRLFKSFERLHPAQEFEGAGIGLAIVKRVVERHGGRVWARAFEGQGAEFGFGLPQDHQ